MAVAGGNVPLPETRPTRQWDAWTREEEENFFGALRQVGKNFEKITSRVQSKNKDQVRHYYYRVIKRMNRILAPTLILDAKNSTYVNSAMLRWWSLLEKHSCSASKLRLKPRRFKTFVTALEHQLLKDHKKAKTRKPTAAAATTRRLASHTETTVSPSRLPVLVSNGSGVNKAIAEDMPTAQAVGAGRRSAVKRKAVSNGSRKAVPKGEAKCPPRPRKKATDGNLSKAAYAKWEKAASVGVSLVAEAAEQLERATAAELILPASEVSEIHSTSTTGGNLVNVDVQTGQIPGGTSAAFSELGLTDKLELPSGLVSETHGLGGVVSSRLSGPACGTQTACLSSVMPVSSLSLKGALPTISKDGTGSMVIIPELCAQVKAKSMALDAPRCNNCSTLRCSSEAVKDDLAGTKLKLQLFPFDDFIRKGLEQDGLNPHLELTFKARKSMFSVLHHLTQKWGRSTVATGELRLFPFNTQWSNVSSCQSWSFQDLNISAADVHAALGNPAVFRLRYAWLSTRVLQLSSAVLQQQDMPLSSIASEGGPGQFQRESHPDMTSNFTSQQSSVLPYASTLQSMCIGASTVSSTEQCRASDPIQSLPLSTVACEIQESRQIGQPAVLGSAVVVDVHVGHRSVDSSQTSVVCSVVQSGSQLVGKFTSANGVPSVAAEKHIDKDLIQPVPCVESFPDGGEGKVNRSNDKELDSSSQVSGCAWLYESNDGFAQQLWNYEDTLRSSNGVSMAQMDWVDSLTNISVSELLGEASRVFSAPSDCHHPCSGPTPLACLDSFDIAIANQELPLPGALLVPMSQPSSTIWGGEETCDAFSFQRQDRCGKETGPSLGDEDSANSLGLDVTFADFRSMACWREQPQHSQSQDLFGGDASLGLGGLIEALAQGSLDGLHACLINHDMELKDEGRAARQDCEISKEAKVGNGDVCSGTPTKDGNGQVTLATLLEQGVTNEHSNGTSELIEMYEKLTETSLPLVSVPSSDVESLKETRPVNARMQRKKELHPPQRPFKLPEQFNSVRSLKLQG